MDTRGRRGEGFKGKRRRCRREEGRKEEGEDGGKEEEEDCTGGGGMHVYIKLCGRRLEDYVKSGDGDNVNGVE